jgi:hypothetical protein
MGVCASTPENNAGAQSQASNAQSSEERELNDKEFRQILKNVTLVILGKLCTALEYEKEGYDEVRQTRNLDSILDLMAPQYFTGVLKETLGVGDAEYDGDVKRTDYQCKKFMVFLESCKGAEFKAGIDSQTLADKFKKAAELTQKELKESSAAADSSDLKIHLNFFHQSLDFVQGDIASNPALLEQNVDTFLGGDSL